MIALIASYVWRTLCADSTKLIKLGQQFDGDVTQKEGSGIPPVEVARIDERSPGVIVKGAHSPITPSHTLL